MQNRFGAEPQPFANAISFRFRCALRCGAFGLRSPATLKQRASLLNRRLATEEFPSATPFGGFVGL
jgi:hypothetical protein